MTQSVEVHVRHRGRHAEVRICRPAAGNTLDEETVLALTQAFLRLVTLPSLRVIVLSSCGDTFCAGVDLHWMKAGAEAHAEENRRSAGILGALFHRIHTSPVPVVARVQGDAVGAGLGLVAACDMAVAVSTARFWTREVRVGILPALMSPYVIQSLGPRLARYHFLTSRPLTAAQALNFGLVQVVRPDGELDDGVDHCLRDLVQASPASLAATKDLVAAVAERPIDDALVSDTVTRIADFRSRALARAGIASAIDGTPPPWKEDHESGHGD